MTVEGCKAKVSREEASSILAETAQLTEGPERERFSAKFFDLQVKIIVYNFLPSAVDKWHYAHLTN